MDLEMEELQSLSIAGIVRESVAIARSSPRTFTLLTLTLVFPLSFAVLAHNLFTHPLLLHITTSNSTYSSDNKYLALLLLYQLLYLLFLFTFSLLSTAAVVFTVASLYSSSKIESFSSTSSKIVSFSSSLSAIPSIFPRLFLTFLHVSFLMVLYNLAFFLSLLLIFLLSPSNPYSPLFLVPLFLLLLAFLLAHLYISALWHLASVVSVLEPIRGLPAMRKAFHLLRGNIRPALALVTAYLAACGIIAALFRAVVVAGPGEEGSLGLRLGAKVFFGGALVSALVIVNLVGLLVQSVFYYVCKSYHHQGIDKGALADHLGGYLGEYVPLKSSVQMESF